MVHELGHFIVAKKAGILVEEFGFGIPPKIIGKKIGKTIYSLNLFPFGGFVRLKGEDTQNEKNLAKDEFLAKPPIIRILVLCAGVFMNVVFGSVFFFLVLIHSNFQSSPMLVLGEKPFVFPFGKTVILDSVVTYIKEQSPAQKAGLSYGDYISAVVDERGDTMAISSAKELQSSMDMLKGKKVSLVVENLSSKKTKTVEVIPEYDNELKRGVIGVGLGSFSFVSYNSPLEKSLSGLLHGVNVTTYSISSMKYLIAKSLETKSIAPVSAGLSGPVGIYRVVDGVISFGGSSVFYNLLDIMGLLSFSLAFFNILPIPALDGGRVLFIIPELVFKKRISSKIEAISHSVGLTILLLLIVLISLKDLFLQR